MSGQRSTSMSGVEIGALTVARAAGAVFLTLELDGPDR